MTEIKKPPQELLDALKEVEASEEGAKYGETSTSAGTYNEDVQIATPRSEDGTGEKDVVPRRGEIEERFIPATNETVIVVRGAPDSVILRKKI